MNRALPNHDGTQRQPDDRFGPAPASIGDLVSASTSASRSFQDIHTGNRPMRLLIGAALGWTAVAACNALITGWGADYHPASFGPGLVVLALFWLGTRYRHQASFVGTAGFAMTSKLFGLFWSRPEVVRLERATGLTCRFVRLTTGDAYRATRFTFVWHDAQGQAVAQLAGRFVESDVSSDRIDMQAVAGLPPHHPLPLALAAERAWRARIGQPGLQEPIRISDPEPGS